MPQGCGHEEAVQRHFQGFAVDVAPREDVLQRGGAPRGAGRGQAREVAPDDFLEEAEGGWGDVSGGARMG